MVAYDSTVVPVRLCRSRLSQRMVAYDSTVVACATMQVAFEPMYGRL